MMKNAILLLCLLCSPVMADEPPAEPPKQEPQLYFECGTMRGSGLLVLVDEDGNKRVLSVSCGPSA